MSNGGIGASPDGEAAGALALTSTGSLSTGLIRLAMVGVVLAVLGIALPIASSSSDAFAQSGSSDPAGRQDPWPNDDAGDIERPEDESDDTAAEQASQHIINGTPIAITERPWHVLVSDEDFDGTWCGGSILAANLILTAAHCVDNPNLDLSRLVIVAGSERWRDLENGQWRFAANVTLHPTYQADGGFEGDKGLDLALVELDRPLTFGPSVQPISLADPDEAAAVLDQEGDLTGWGVTTLPARDNDTVETLRHGVGEIISDSFCGALIGRPLNTAFEMCLDGFNTGQTGCFGDSGGATTVEIGGERKIVGVASFTISECSFDILVLAETATARDWIAQNTPPLGDGAGFVGGRVFDDTNFNSVEDPGEGGLAGVEVTLSIPPPPPSTAPAIALTTVTDAQGRFAFNAPSGGWYQVSITIDPLVVLSPPTGEGTEATNTDVWSRFYDPLLVEPTVGYSARFLLRSGQAQVDVDFGATQGALVSGVVFDDVDRNGRRDLGEPIAERVDAYIDLYRISPEGDFDRVVDSRSTFSDANFAMAVPPGPSYLSFYDLFTDRDVTLPNRGDDLGDNDFSPFTNASETFTAVAGEIYTFDLGLTPAGSGPVFVDVANIDCDGNVSIVDALVIAQFSANLRTDGGNCPLADPSAQLHAANADFNLDGSTDIIDALLIAQCVADVATPFCDSLP